MVIGCNVESECKRNEIIVNQVNSNYIFKIILWFVLNALWCVLIRSFNECLVLSAKRQLKWGCIITFTSSDMNKGRQLATGLFFFVFWSIPFPGTSTFTFLFLSTCSTWLCSINCSSCSVAAFKHSSIHHIVDQHTPVRSGKGHVNPNRIKIFEISVHFLRKKTRGHHV